MAVTDLETYSKPHRPITEPIALHRRHVLEGVQSGRCLNKTMLGSGGSVATAH